MRSKQLIAWMLFGMFALSLLANAPGGSGIQCGEQGCGAGCPSGYCAQASYCTNCFMYECWSEEYKQFITVPCSP
jgi:hypothetical protein